MNNRICSLSVTKIPYSGSPGELIWSCTARLQEGPTPRIGACCDRTTPWKGRKAHGGPKATWNRVSRSRDISTRDLFVDKGNSAQSTCLLSYVCTITLRGVAWCGKGQEQQPLLTCHGILSSPRQGDNHPVLLPLNRLVKARPRE